VSIAALAFNPAAAHAITVPLRENACLKGATGSPGCIPSAPHEEDLGRAMMTVTAPNGTNAYVLEQKYTVGVRGGLYNQATDTIVQEHLNGQEPPQFASCVSDRPTPDCTQFDENAMFTAQSEVIAPGGQNLYVASRAGVARFSVEPTGALHYMECLRAPESEEEEEKQAAGEGAPCFAPKWSAGQYETEQLTIAPDEKDLYLTIDQRLVDVRLGPGGTMALGRCYTFRSICPRGGAASEEYGMAAVTPDGQFVLSVMTNQQVNVYRREANGALRFTGCLGSVGEGGAYGDACPVSAANPGLPPLEAIAIAPNSRDVYVTGGSRTGRAGESRPIVLLHLTSAGSLEFAGCWAVEAGGCADLPLPATPVEGPTQVGKRIAVSDDGTHLLLAARTGNDLFRIDPASGGLTWEGCVGRDAGCERMEAEPIDGQGGSVEFTPGGREAWMDDAGTAVRMRLGATAPDEPPPPVPDSGRARVSEYTVDFCAPLPAHGPNVSFYYEIEGPAAQVFYTPAYADPYECAGDELVANTRVQLGDSYRYRLVSRTPAGTAAGPWQSFSTQACPHPLEEGRGAKPTITPTSLTWVEGNGYDCPPHKVTLDYGETPAYGHTVTATSHYGMRNLWKEGGFHVSVGGLQPKTTVYWRLRLENGSRTEVISEGVSTTAEPVSGAIETFAQTAGATAQGNGSVTLSGYAWSGDTPATVAAQIFAEARFSAEPARAITIGQLPASRERAVLTTTVPGLQCGREYDWRLVTEAAYGNSYGAREPFTIPCPHGLEVTQNPISVSVNEGEPVSFEAAARGQPAPTVQWQVSSDAGATWQDIAGATRDTLTLWRPTAAQSGNEYRAVFKNASGEAATKAAVLTVGEPTGQGSKGATEEETIATPGPTVPTAGSGVNPPVVTFFSTPLAPAVQGILASQTTHRSLAVLSTKLKPSRGGAIRLIVRCPMGGGDCRGKLSLERLELIASGTQHRVLLLARTVFTIRQGASASLALHLPSAVLRMLSREGVMHVRAMLLTDGAGRSAVNLTLVSRR
jgi:hypothetical protein